ncbi:MAG: hypothetical protein NUV69_03310 [Candidatus Curtissbacteria bacterium]|nr:hypothetical protein [Candidatus Curtissbacteria bacterium]
MELKDYLKILRKNATFVLILMLFGAVIAILVTVKIPSGYKYSKTFFIKPGVEANNTEAFFVQEKTRNFTDTAQAIIESADFKTEVMNSGESISVKKLAPQVLQITTFSKSKEASTSLMQKIQDSYNTKVAALEVSNQKSTLQPLGTAPEPAFTKANKIVFVTAGLLAGAAMAIFAISLKTYFKV